MPIRLWLAASVLAAGLRLAAWAAHRRRPDAWPPRRWTLLHVTGAAVNGVLWGALPVLFFAPNAVAEHMFLSAVIVGPGLTVRAGNAPPRSRPGAAHPR